MERGEKQFYQKSKHLLLLPKSFFFNFRYEQTDSSLLLQLQHEYHFGKESPKDMYVPALCFLEKEPLGYS